LLTHIDLSYRANVEIARVKQALEKDLLTMKTKLTKVETQLKSTQASLENKITENADLTKVCDDLLAQLEGAP
jgi:septal ring factor EnvC (AmiA/AmiB activator)